MGYQWRVALHAPESIGPDGDPLSFQVDRFERDDEAGLELHGRWFGIRGRRFVRPTLTFRIDGARHRLLADLADKPWPAREGEDWFAVFSPLPAGTEAQEIELSVAPDIVIPLSAPTPRGAGTPLSASAGRAAGAGTSAGTAASKVAPSGSGARLNGVSGGRASGPTRASGRLTTGRAGSSPGTARDPRSRIASARAAIASPARPGATGPAPSLPSSSAIPNSGAVPIDQERTRARELRRALAEAESDRERLRQEQARSRAQIAELQRQLRSAESPARAAASASAPTSAPASTSRENAGGELRRALTEAESERDRAVRELGTARERAAELTHKLKKSDANFEALRAEARTRIEAERAEVERLRGALRSQEALVAQRDRLAGELKAAMGERDRLATQASQATHAVRAARAAQAEAAPPPDPARIARILASRPTSRAYRSQHSGSRWPERALAVIPLCAVLLTLALMLHLI